jgi:type II secretory ATPase GspE/PulE/Tfp pilus assembly ATPase PilB-like protein
MDKDIQGQLANMRREAEERDAQRRATAQGVPYLEPNRISVDLDALALLEKPRAVEAQAAIIEAKEKALVMIAPDPKFSKTKEAIEELKQRGYTLTMFIVSESSLQYAFSFYQYVAGTRESIVGSVRMKEKKEGNDMTDNPEQYNTVIKAQEAIKKYNVAGEVTELLQVILLGAVGTRASDVHLEPRQKGAKIRYRIDGILNDVFDALSSGAYRTLLSRIKLLAKLKLNVQDEPQDGRFTINFSKKAIEVRVAVAPSEYGEVVVMRLLDPDAINLGLKDLGLRDDDLVIIKKQLATPNGMIINTGPTGSGKTTTLYTFLRHKNSAGIKIITIEDPIEYHIEGLEQTQVDPEAGYTFASGLRSLMRQDPDVILVGEIRDKETAEIAVQAALTGHLVFSTVHANDAAAGIPRLLDLGVKTVSLAPALNMLIAQRLVRVLCEHCKQPVKLDEATMQKITAYVQAMPDRVDKKTALSKMTMFQAKEGGCEQCSNTGYHGRLAIFELLLVSPQLQELIIKGAGQLEIQKVIDATDFVRMQQDGVLKVIEGITTFDEVERETGPIKWATPTTDSR